MTTTILALLAGCNLYDPRFERFNATGLVDTGSTDADTDVDSDSDSDSDSDTDTDTHETGETGETGDTSDTSDTGDSADSGDSGDTADSGDSGDSGDTGIVDTGDTADTGDSGDTGSETGIVDTADTSFDTSVVDTGDTGSVIIIDIDGDGYTADVDCDDADAAINPSATEVCDGVDNDCDGATDESGATGETTWYDDADADGYGSSALSVTACDAPVGYVASSTDCDDTSASIHFGASETCNSVDDDCDGSVDDGLATATWYDDGDGDGYGDASVSTISCSVVAGAVGNDDDCDDLTAAVNPAAIEACDAVDNDCDGGTDESGATGESLWYDDADGDGYGDGSVSTLSCSALIGTVADATDCNDADVTVNPSATEVCDSADNDCDGSVDNVVGASHTTVVRFAPDFTAFTGIVISGELLDSSGGDVLAWEDWSTGTPSGMTVTTSTTSITATYSGCVESTETWYVNIGFTTSSGSARYGCEDDGDILGMYTVTVDGSSVTTGSCGTDPYGENAYSW